MELQLKYSFQLICLKKRQERSRVSFSIRIRFPQHINLAHISHSSCKYRPSCQICFVYTDLQSIIMHRRHKYGSAHKSCKKMIELIYNQHRCLCLGMYRKPSADSSCIETSQPSLEHRPDELAIQCNIKFYSIYPVQMQTKLKRTISLSAIVQIVIPTMNISSYIIIAWSFLDYQATCMHAYSRGGTIRHWAWNAN